LGDDACVRVAVLALATSARNGADTNDVIAVHVSLCIRRAKDHKTVTPLMSRVAARSAE
jgi:hypothetical protein